MADRKHAWRAIGWLGALCALLPAVCGCSAFRPMNGIPSAYLPDEYRDPSRSDTATIDWSLLRQSEPDEYRIDTDDVLGIYVEGVLGTDKVPPPVHNPTNQDDPPSVGFPISVRADGTISLPGYPAISVRGMTLTEVEREIRRVITHSEKPWVQPGQERILVSLQRKRTYRVLVMRQEAANNFGSTGTRGSFNADDVGTFTSTKRGMGRVVRLPAYKNDVLHALAETGGPPGIDAINSVYIMRSRSGKLPGEADVADPLTLDDRAGTRLASGWDSAGDVWGHCPLPGLPDAMTISSPHVIEIPLRMRPGEFPRFSEDDIILHDGDVVYIETREREFFFTGGLLGGGQHVLPRDYDVDVLGAVAIAEGQSNRIINTSQSIAGVSALNQDVTVGASNLVILRPMPDGHQLSIKVDLRKALRDPNERVFVQPGDYLLLQYTPVEAVAAFFERHLIEGTTLALAAAAFQNNN